MAKMSLFLWGDFYAVTKGEILTELHTFLYISYKTNIYINRRFCAYGREFPTIIYNRLP